MNNLIESLCSTVKFRLDEVENILERFKKISISKDRILLNDNEVCNSLWFINSGCLALMCKAKEQEKIVRIFTENCFAIDIYSYLQQKPQNLVLQSLNNCELMVLQKNDLDELYATMQSWKDFMHCRIQEAYLSCATELLTIKICNNEERYYKLQNEQPELFQQIPLKTIANYLGITPVGLSKLRGRRIKMARASRTMYQQQVKEAV